jgi:hypothetical protein
MFVGVPLGVQVSMIGAYPSYYIGSATNMKETVVRGQRAVFYINCKEPGNIIFKVDAYSENGKLVVTTLREIVCMKR